MFDNVYRSQNFEVIFPEYDELNLLVTRASVEHFDNISYIRCFFNIYIGESHGLFEMLEKCKKSNSVKIIYKLFNPDYTDGLALTDYNFTVESTHLESDVSKGNTPVVLEVLFKKVQE